jgi:prolyl-tRNA editing enzyme YbaK/EbsC (Cys-tRNA(Pro) deacylase)
MLLLFFDDLKEDHAGTVRRIAKFMRVELDDDTVARVVHTTSHTEMSRIASKFDARKIALTLSEKIGEEPGEIVGRVRKNGGKSGEGKQKLPVEVQERIDQMWKEIVTSKLGFQNLKEMRQAWTKEQ